MLTQVAPRLDCTRANQRVLVAQLGARQNYTVPIALQNLSCLERFYTDTYLNPRDLPSAGSESQMGWLRTGFHRLFSRQQGSLALERVTRFHLLGWRFRQALWQAQSSQEKYQCYLDYSKAFNQGILRLGLPDATHLYAFDHGARQLFEVARSRGMQCILDQIYPALYEEHLEQEEELRWRNWALCPRTPVYRSPAFQRWCETQWAEWQLADRILVPSSHCQRAITTMAPMMQSKLRIVPWSVNLEDYLPQQRIRQFSGDRPLRVLFVGALNLRKGIPYLLQAFQQIDPRLAQLTLVGKLQLRAEKLAPFQARVDFRPDVPVSQLPKIYRAADLLVFPTLSDSFGAAILAAMATGLPVIATDRCADLVEEGVNGYRIPSRQPTAIAEKIHHLVQQPDLLARLSAGAIATSQHHTLATYQARLAQVLQLADPLAAAIS